MRTLNLLVLVAATATPAWPFTLIAARGSAARPVELSVSSALRKIFRWTKTGQPGGPKTEAARKCWNSGHLRAAALLSGEDWIRTSISLFTRQAPFYVEPRRRNKLES